MKDFSETFKICDTVSLLENVILLGSTSFLKLHFYFKIKPPTQFSALNSVMGLPEMVHLPT